MSINYIQRGVVAAVCSIVISQPSIAAAPVDFSSLVQTVSPAVVRVNVSKKMSQEELLQQQMPELLRRFFGNNVQIPNQRLPQEQNAYGSAFFITKDGYLLTNHHVIADASKVTPIIVVTADTAPDLRERCIEAGADEVIFKPVAMDALFDAIGRLLARGEGQIS